MEQLFNEIMKNQLLMTIITKGLKILIVLLVSNLLIKLLTSRKSFLSRLQKKLNQNGESRTSIAVVSKVLKVLIYIVDVVIIVSEFGYDLSGLITGLGLSGVIITLAAQDTAKNLFGGLVIFLDKPFKVGDYIQLPTCDGTVEEITFRSTKIRTLENSLLHIPNSEISSTIVTNYSEMQKRRYKTNLIIELGTPLAKMDMLIKHIEEMLRQTDKVFTDTISVKFQNISDNGNEIVVIAYVDIISYAEFLDKKQQINYKIMHILEEDGVELAYNTQTIFVKRD